jgi:hypothetical protein
MQRKAKEKKAATKSKAAPAKGSARGKGSPGNEVERRWNEYWSCRQQLEDAVEKVRLAREVLQKAQEAERERRAEFEGIKRSLTALLDVEAPGASQRQAVATLPQPAGSPGSAPAPKQAS